ncbi:hypothetical protein CLU79DRAFT_707655, partial [Phycomyces nitens]
WTGERLGAAKATLQTDDFQRMQSETEKRRAGFEMLYNVAQLTHVYLSKRKVSPEDNKTKMTAMETFGQSLSNYGAAHDDLSDLGAVMAKMGETEKQISVFQAELSSVLKDRYIAMLNGGLRLFKEYSSLKKKLESRRLDHDAKQTRVNKAKKEKLEWEQEYQTAKMKYEETKHNLINKMVEIEEFEGVYLSELRILLEAQYSYHLKSLETIESLRKDWPMPADNGYANYDHTGYAKSHRSTATNLSGSDATTPDVLRRVTFSFDGENQDELTLRTGDIIRVLNAVDDGWWLGEIDGRRGIFPVNYTEPTCETPPPLVPCKSAHTTPVENPSDEPNTPTHCSQAPHSSDPTQATISPAPNVLSNNNNNNYNNNNNNNNNNLPDPTMSSQAPPRPLSSLSDGLTLSTGHRFPPPPVPSRSKELCRATTEALIATGIARS